MRLLYVLLLVLSACRPQHSGDDDDDADAAVVPDGPDGSGCTALTPRMATPESFIGPNGLENRLNALIDGATSSLDVHMYLFTVTSLANKIVAAKQRGVSVRVILDPDSPGNANVTPIFTSGGVTWKNASTIYSYSHAKYLVIDRTTVVIMSNNFNYDAMSNERNYGMVDRDPEDVADVQAIFEQDWQLANGQPATAANLACTRLIVSPNNAKQRVIDHINSATSSLDVEVMYVSEMSVQNAIGAAKMRGVNVRVIINEATDASVTYFKSLGIPVKTPGSFYLHAKLLIADQVAFIGSENMSFTSLSKNREVGALVFEPSAFTPVKQQFETDWSSSTLVP